MNLKSFFVVFLVCVPATSLAAQTGAQPGAAASQTPTVFYAVASREIIEKRLASYQGNDKEREATLKQMFADAGCGEHITEQPVKGAKLPNVICTLPGASERTIIVGAHFDHVSAGNGVVDNWSGASLLPSLYQAVRDTPRTHTYLFIGFTDEEEGEVGSHYFVQHMTKQDIANTDAMVNMDTLGLAPTEVWASHSDKRLTAILNGLARSMNLPLTAVNVEQVGSTDSEQFAVKKIPSITIHSLTQQAWNMHILHTANDRMSAIRMDDYYQSYRLIAAYVADLDVPGVVRPEAK
jgi:putative aminopeptidase FrvX